jgi:DNA-binding response OmpR family regulator
MDGVALARELKSINPKAVIVASTGHFSPVHEAEFRALGVNGFLKKPFDIEKLLATVHGAIHSVLV